MIIKGNTLIINAELNDRPISKVKKKKKNPFHSVKHPFIFINIRYKNVTACFIIPKN